MEKLNYVPNTLARTLKVGTGDTVGVVIDTIADPFFAAVTSAVEATALDAGLATVFGSTGFDPDREHRQVERMAMQQVRALILAPVPRSHDYLRRYAAGLPDRHDRPRGRGRRVRHGAGRRPGAGPRRGRAPAAGTGTAGSRSSARTRRSPPPATGCAGYHEVLAERGVNPARRCAGPTPDTDADAVRVLARAAGRAGPADRDVRGQPPRRQPDGPRAAHLPTAPSWRSSASATSRCPSRCARR